MEKKFDNLYAFVLGREQKIARAEFECVLRHFYFYFDKNNPELCRRMNFSILSLSGNVALINILRGEDFSKSGIMSVLGGTMEIYQIIGLAETLDPDIIYSQIHQLFKGYKGRVTFGISDYSKSFAEAKINTLGLDVKKKLRENFSARFVALRSDSHLSSAAVISNRLHKDGVLLGIFLDNKQYLIGRLIGVTNPNEWSKRDFGKPKSDKFGGMCPPKLARMIINIVLGQVMTKSETINPKKCPNDQNHNSSFGFRDSSFERVVVDPFCGSGNILMEAMMLGCNVIGSDISEKAVNNTRANLEWLTTQNSNPSTDSGQALKTQTCNLKLKNLRTEGLKNNLAMKQCNNYEVFVADATKSEFAEKLKNLRTEGLKNIVIVTEPYLGNPKKFKPTLNAVRGEYQKVKKLYLDFLKNISQLTTKNNQLTTMCVIFPLVETMEGRQYSLFNEYIDEIKNLGYTLICDPMIYGRDYQVVKRQIVLLKLDNSKTIARR